VLLGWGMLGQQLSAAQIAGMVIVVASVWLSQRAQRAAAITPAPRPL
jgi:probable blue pigment (indigoidine) exporter